MEKFNLINKFTLSFKNKNLEDEFIEYYNHRFLNQYKFALLLAIFLYGIFGYLDVYLYGAIGYYFLKIRLLLVCPYFALVVFILLKEKFLKNIQLILLSCVIVSGIGVLEMIKILHQQHFNSNIYFNGLIIIIIYCYTFLRIRFILACIGGLFNLIGYEIVSIFLTKIPFDLIITNNFFFLSISLIGMIVNYNLELDTRKYFLLLEELRREKENLKRENIFLDNLAHIDELTGIPNKRFFYENLKFFWNNHLNKNYLSLLIIDVDNFKKYNDCYGHIEGDKCLKKIANTLEKLIRRSKDILARFGGEEFVILLPETDKITAKKVANRIKTKIRNLKIKHDTSEVDKYVTISVGGATCIPKEKIDFEIFVKTADQALYDAKNSGKNKVCFFKEEVKHENRNN